MSDTIPKKMTEIILILIFLLASSFALGQTPTDTEAASAEKEYLFNVKGTSKKNPAKAVLKLTEKKDLVYLYFEGSELQSGKYKILKAESCAILKKEIRSKKPQDEANELYSFETKYGNISGERNLSFKSFQELGVGQIAVALVKDERKNSIVISCLD